MHAEPLVSIVIVSYNATDYLRRCLETVRRRTRPPHEILVIDNASRPDTREYLRSLDFIRLTLNDDNRLWCAGCNQGIRQAAASSRYVLLLNPDIEVLRDDWLDRMVAIAESEPRVGLVGTRHQYRPIAPVYGWLDGQCLLAQRSLIEEVGLLDEARFPWGGAPQLLAVQAALRGWRYKVVPPWERLVVHHGHKSRTENPGQLPRHGRTLASLMEEQGLPPRPVPSARQWLERFFPRWRNRRLGLYPVG
jgi:GT2 family glycosyltransferase